MKEGPDIALLGSLIGDPARANMLTALMSGKALTARELATEAGVTAPTASSHLSQLEAAGLVYRRRQGRHHYIQLADDEVASLLESMMGLAVSRGLTRTRTGPKDPALRKARVCYNHLAGELGVHLYDSLLAEDAVATDGDAVTLTDLGREQMIDFGIDVAALDRLRRPLCRLCLDWSNRRMHLAGALGTAVLDRILQLKWAKRLSGSRIVAFSPGGERRFLERFPV